MCRVIVEHKVAKEIESLPNQIIQSVFDALEGLKIQPRPHGVKKLLGRDGWRVRIRDYRALYTMDDQQRLVRVYRIKHRRDVCR